jgi:acyl carrier protein
MNKITPRDVQVFLTEYLARKLQSNGRVSVEELPEDCDLLLTGMIDSIGFLELVAALEKFANREIDFEMLDPEEMTIVGPLCKFVAEQAGSAA